MTDRTLAAFALRDVAAFDFRVGNDGEVWFLSATAIPSFAREGALFAATRATGLSRDATVLAVLRSAAARHGLTPMLDASKVRAPRTRRTSLRVGLAFNMKRIDSQAGDDCEAEYDAPETIHSITSAIESHGHIVVPLEATPDFPRALMASNVDVVFNIAEGMAGRSREAQVPSLCELLGVPYTGSDSATLSICLDKSLAKRLLVDVDTPVFQVLTTGREKLRPLRYPVIVKPNQEGTSKGITAKSVCDDEASVREVARELIDRYGQPALLEEYVFGREVTVGLLGERRPRVLPPMEVVFMNAGERPVYDYQCKQQWQDHVRYECPANLTREELRAVERACRATFMALGCRDVARVDLRLTEGGRVYVIEVNPLPGLTPNYSDLCLIANGAQNRIPDAHRRNSERGHQAMASSPAKRRPRRRGSVDSGVSGGFSSRVHPTQLAQLAKPPSPRLHRTFWASEQAQRSLVIDVARYAGARRSPLGHRGFGATLGCLLAMASPAPAQTSPSIDARTFRPSMDPQAGIVFEPVVTPGPLRWNVGSWMSYAYDPIPRSDGEGRPIDHAIQPTSSRALGSAKGSVSASSLRSFFGSEGAKSRAASSPAVTFRRAGWGTSPFLARPPSYRTRETDGTPARAWPCSGQCHCQRDTLTSFAGEGAVDSIDPRPRRDGPVRGDREREPGLCLAT